MKIAIMQPYFFPYIGYFQLINAVDSFIVYDNIKYTKKGWINRNRILIDNKDQYFTIPIKKGSDSLNISERELSDIFNIEKGKILRKVKEVYRNAPYFNNAFQLFEDCLSFSLTNNLFDFIYNSIEKILEHLEVKTRLIVSSSIEPDGPTLKGQVRVINLCRTMNSDVYINPIGGIQLYNQCDFSEKGIKLKFLKTGPIEYKQFGNSFIGNLSILDMMMFNPIDKINVYLNTYTLI